MAKTPPLTGRTKKGSSLPRPFAQARASRASASRRARIIATLLGICRDLERMQVAAEGRQACREVAALLARLK